MKTFAIYGTIIDTENERTGIEDLTPAQFRSFLKNLAPNEELEIEINSPGGSVYGGIAIANMIRKLSASGHKVSAIVEGLAASIASVIMCACDRIAVHESSLVMIHNCWSTVQGDSNAIRKEAEAMDKMNEAILSFYCSKFDLDKNELKTMMDNETWFSGKEVESFGFDCEVIPDENGYSIAAKLKDIDFAIFKHAPTNLKERICMKKLDEEKKVEKEIEEEEIEKKEIEEEVKEANEEVTEEEKKETEEENETVEEEETDNGDEVEEENPEEASEEDESDEEKKPTITKAECEKRVSGMQSTMAKQIDTMRKQYEAKINDFENKVQAMTKELEKVKAESTRLKSTLEKTEKELSETISAFKEKETALASLNARVNHPNQDPEMKPWKNLHGEALLKWCRENQVR